MSIVTIRVNTDVAFINETTRSLKIRAVIKPDSLTNPDYFANNNIVNIFYYLNNIDLNLPEKCKCFYAPNLINGEINYNETIEKVLVGFKVVNSVFPINLKELQLPNAETILKFLPVNLKKLNIGNINNHNNGFILPELKSNLVSLTARKIINPINEDFFKEFSNLKELFLGDSITKIDYLPNKLEYLEINSKTKLPKKFNKNITIKRV